MSRARDVLMAAVIGAHGLKGEVKVKAFTVDPETLGAYGPLHAKDGRRFTVEVLRPVGGRDDEAIVAFAEVKDRNASEALKGTELFVARDKLPDAGGNEFYHADLVGLEAFDTDGRRIGTVQSIQNYGAGDVLVIAADEGEEILLAFTKDNVPDLDVANGRITVAVPDEIDAGDEGDRGEE
jgi:16S rRNA processing protein RimM